jgi:hypothetical protein
MLKRPLYVGILTSGESRSETIPALQIVSNALFDRAQEILKERARGYLDRRVPMNTKGDALLSGNVFCGHCGSRLVITTNGKKYVRKTDGETTVTPKARYVCYNKTRHPDKCDGQTGYTVKKLDCVIEEIVQSLFQRVKEQPREELIEKQFEERLETCRLNLTQARSALKGEQEVLNMLEDEVIKVIQGTSALKPELLNRKHDEAEQRVAEKSAIVATCERELQDSENLLAGIKKQYSEVTSWAEIFSDSPVDVKKMIVSQLISDIRVSRDYHIDIAFRISAKQLGLALEYDAPLPKKAKAHTEMAL